MSELNWREESFVESIEVQLQVRIGVKYELGPDEIKIVKRFARLDRVLSSEKGPATAFDLCWEALLKYWVRNHLEFVQTLRGH